MDENDKKLVDSFAGYALAAFMLSNATAMMQGDKERRRAIDGALIMLEHTAADAAKSPVLVPIYDAARQHLEALLSIDFGTED